MLCKARRHFSCSLLDNSHDCIIMSTQQIIIKNWESNPNIDLPVNGIPLKKNAKLIHPTVQSRHSWEDVLGLSWILNEEGI